MTSHDLPLYSSVMERDRMEKAAIRAIFDNPLHRLLLGELTRFDRLAAVADLPQFNLSLRRL
jgi:hypothetical protein